MISADDLRKTINPSDGDLEAFFKKNAARYATAVPEAAQDHLLCLYAQPAARRRSAAHAAGDSAVLHRAPDRVLGSGAGAFAPHPDQGGRGRGRQDRCRGQGQGRGHSEADSGRRRTLPIWPRRTPTTPAARTRAANWALPSAAAWCRSSTTPSSRRRSATSQIVKSQFGYHIVQVEERQTAHAQSLSEVLPTIQATLIRQKAAQAEENYAQALTSEAIKNGLEKTAAAHHLEVVTTPLVGQPGRDRRAARRLAAARQGLRVQAGRSAAVCAHRRGLRDLPGHRNRPGARARFADWKSHVARRLPRRAAAHAAQPEDQGAGRQGQGR